MRGRARERKRTEGGRENATERLDADRKGERGRGDE